MRRSEVIAQCLHNSRMVGSVNEGVVAVKKVFAECYPSANFDVWDIKMNDAVARSIIGNVGVSSRINVRLFIRDLSQKG